MKAPFLHRPVLFLLLLVVATLSACKKDPEVDPDLGNRVAGQYSLTELKYNGQSYTGKDLPLKGSVKVTRTNATSVTMDFNINEKEDNAEVINGEVEDISLADKGGEIELSSDGEKVGRISGNKLYIEVEDDNGDEFTLILTK